MARTRILIIDDDPDQHTVCGVLLEHAGYHVLHARDGEEGVRMARTHRPELVLMDIRMYPVDGIAARRAMSQDAETADIPVVAVSADVVAWPERRVLAEGFAAYLPKPCNLRRMLAIVERFTGLEAAREFAGEMAMAV